MRKIIVAMMATLGLALSAAPAMAWNGEKVDLVSCGEVDISVGHENGPWGFEIRQWTGLSSVVIATGTTPSPASGTKHLSIGVRGTDNAEHLITVRVGNATNLNDGANGPLPDGSGYFTGCGPLPAGPPGPAGQNGQNGVGYACDGTPVFPVLEYVDNEQWVRFAIPTCPGTPGKDGADGGAGAAGANADVVVQRLTTIAPAPRACVSRRKFQVTLPKSYRNLSKVKVFKGGKLRVMKIVKHGKIGLDFTGFTCGQYAVAIRQHGRKSVRLLYTLGGTKRGGGNLTAYNVPVKARP